jgi:adenine-specific DNA methylase
MTPYPRRLIEVDLPIKRISAHARREKSIRHGHISTLHIWWARRPLAACRAVICAALWPDPADPLCPQTFRDAASRSIAEFARKVCGQGKIGTANLLATCSEDSLKRWEVLSKPGSALDTKDDAHLNVLRFALLDFIADFANWDNSTVPEYLETARALTQAAHEALGGEPGTRPLVVDPFAGGGSIPLEALRVGADAFASDLNPVAVLLNKVVLEYIPKYGQKLADEVRKWGQWIKEQAEKELAAFYPKDPDGATPIAYLWARTITCEGPGCGAEVPLMRSLWLAKKGKRSVALSLVPRPRAKRVDFEIIENAKAKDVGEGTVKRGSATCPVCGFTTPVVSVRKQLKERRGGATDARLFCVVTTRPGEQGRFYRLPTERDLAAVRAAAKELERRKAIHKGSLSLVPDEPLDVRGIRHTWAMIYGIDVWGDLFTPRQALALSTLARLVGEAGREMAGGDAEGLTAAVQTLLGLAVSRQTDATSSLCRWHTTREIHTATFGRQAIPMVWDHSEVNVLSEATGSFSGAVEWVSKVCEGNVTSSAVAGHVERASAAAHPLPDDLAHALVTDPPYYDAVPYAYLSDFFYVWLRRSIGHLHPEFLRNEQVPKDAEIVVDRPHELSQSSKDIVFYERELTKAFGEGCRILRSDGIGVIVFASKTTASWEAILQAVVDASWTITGSWPIDTEMENRIAAQGQARLASSVHLVCRPRGQASIGDWRDVLTELPKRIHEWMPRLASEGIVGADAIFACLGPALEIFSRYQHVEKASGEQISLKEYLEHVWAAVSKEALSMIFAGADASGFDPDARLTAMWFWTLSTGASNGENAGGGEEAESDDEEDSGKSAKVSGFVLEYDAARKIAQGLGAHLEQITGVVEVKGDKARLLPVSERARHLFGKDEGRAPAKRAKVAKQKTLFDESEGEDGEEGSWGELNVPQAGETVLDRLHQGMILFAAGRGEALRRFLVEEGVGRDTRFWRLAQALSALYPPGTEEKRWVDGVLGRKKGLGF